MVSIERDRGQRDLEVAIMLGMGIDLYRICKVLDLAYKIVLLIDYDFALA
jgi:hypothetical protein